MKRQFIQLIAILTTLTLLLLGCQANKEEGKATGFSSGREPYQTNLIPQHKADEVKEKLRKLREIDEASVVVLKDDTFVALSVSGHHRFFLKGIREDAHEMTKEMTKTKSVHVTTDRKVKMELEKLENEIANGTVTKKEVEKRLKKIEKDMKG